MSPQPPPALQELRSRIRQIETGGKTAGRVLPSGLPEIDASLPGGGLALGAVHEVVEGGDLGVFHAAAATLFVAEHATALNLNLEDRRLRLTLELAQQLMGTPRHLSQHPGGFVLTQDRLDELVPIEPAAMEDRQVIEWDKDDIDVLKMMKVDILGLGMLACMRWAFELLEEHKDNLLPVECRSCPSALERSALRNAGPGLRGQVTACIAVQYTKLQHAKFSNFVTFSSALLGSESAIDPCCYSGRGYQRGAYYYMLSIKALLQARSCSMYPIQQKGICGGTCWMSL